MTKYQEYFDYRNRADGTKYWCLQDGSPSELEDLVRDIHFDIFEGCLPNDWIYDIISQAINELEENGNDLNDCSIEADAYYSDLYKWLGYRFSTEFCNSAVEEGYCDGRNIIETIGYGQHSAMMEIYHCVHDFLEKMSDQEEEEMNG